MKVKYCSVWVFFSIDKKFINFIESTTDFIGLLDNQGVKKWNRTLSLLFISKLDAEGLIHMVKVFSQ